MTPMLNSSTSVMVYRKQITIESNILYDTIKSNMPLHLRVDIYQIHSPATCAAYRLLCLNVYRALFVLQKLAIQYLSIYRHAPLVLLATVLQNIV